MLIAVQAMRGTSSPVEMKKIIAWQSGHTACLVMPKVCDAASVVFPTLCPLRTGEYGLPKPRGIGYQLNRQAWGRRTQRVGG
jgi:hypothetical protein